MLIGIEVHAVGGADMDHRAGIEKPAFELVRDQLDAAEAAAAEVRAAG